MRKTVFAAIALLSVSGLCFAQTGATAEKAKAAAPKVEAKAAAKAEPAKAEKAKTPADAKKEAAAAKQDHENTLYAIGLYVGKGLDVFMLKSEELKSVQSGISDAVLNKKPKVSLDDYRMKIMELVDKRRAAQSAQEKKLGAAFAEKTAKEPGAVVISSGIVYVEIKAGTGASPKAEDTVKVHYHGTDVKGNVFDSSVQRNEPVEFPLNGVIPCWTESVQKMKVGGKAKIVCPSDTAYGDMGRPPRIAPGATLVFEVELLDIVKPQPEAAAAPAAQEAKPVETKPAEVKPEEKK